MKKNLFFYLSVANILKVYDSLRLSYVISLILFFSSMGIIRAQQFNYQQKITEASIVLKDGAKLYSKDASFNKQILSNKITLKNSEISYQKSKDDSNFLIAKQSTKREDNELPNQLKIAENIKQKEALQKVKKEMDKFEERVHSFSELHFNSYPSPKQLFSSTSVAKNYTVPTQSNHDFSKVYITATIYRITEPLHFLHSRKHIYYNSTSLDFCFSEVFSVRPPPLLV